MHSFCNCSKIWGFRRSRPAWRCAQSTPVAGSMTNGRLRFPRALVEDVIARTRRKFILHGIDPSGHLRSAVRRVHTGTGGAAPTIMDFETGKYRESTVADLYDIARLVDRLDNIHWYHRSVVARDTDDDPRSRHQHHLCLPLGHHEVHRRQLHRRQQRARRACRCWMRSRAARASSANAPSAPPSAAMWCRRCALPPKAATRWKRRSWPGCRFFWLPPARPGRRPLRRLPGRSRRPAPRCWPGLILCNIIDPDCRGIFATWPFVSDLRTGAMSGGSGEQALAVGGLRADGRVLRPAQLGSRRHDRQQAARHAVGRRKGLHDFAGGACRGLDDPRMRRDAGSLDGHVLSKAMCWTTTCWARSCAP